MPTPLDIDKSTSIGSCGANLERYYLQFRTMVVSFDDNTKSHFFLSALQQKCNKVDQFVDRLDTVPNDDLLPEELTLTELILRIKYIHSFQNSAPAIINRYVRSTNGEESSTTHHNHQSPYSDSRPVHACRTHSNTQCICGHWSHSVENGQQIAIHFLIVKYFQKNANLASASQISECWRLTNQQ
jgi:hypothetical protein